MDESEKEINTGNRVFCARKHCIFVKGEGKRPPKSSRSGNGEGIVELSVE
jgi:hypothetical protein